MCGYVNICMGAWACMCVYVYIHNRMMINAKNFRSTGGLSLSLVVGKFLMINRVVCECVCLRIFYVCMGM